MYVQYGISFLDDNLELRSGTPLYMYTPLFLCMYTVYMPVCFFRHRSRYSVVMIVITAAQQNCLIHLSASQ